MKKVSVVLLCLGLTTIGYAQNKSATSTNTNTSSSNGLGQQPSPDVRGTQGTSGGVHNSSRGTDNATHGSSHVPNKAHTETLPKGK